MDGRPEHERSDAGDPRSKHPFMTWVSAVLACLLVMFALIAPNDITRFTPGAFVRIPLEGLVGVVLVLVLPGRARRVVATLAGVALGLLAIVKVVDLGFYAVLDRPFNLTFDWPFLAAAVEYLTVSIGRAGAIGSVAGAVVLAVTLLTFTTLSVLRLTRVVTRHRATAARAVVLLGAAWVACAVLGAQIIPGVPVAASTYDRLLQVRASLHDQQAFAAEAAVDAFRDTPGTELLTGLRGKDVILAFVESYGRGAVEDPEFAPGVDAVLDAGGRRLRAAGFSSRSAFLSSPTAVVGWPIPPCCPACGSTTSNATRTSSRVTA